MSPAAITLPQGVDWPVTATLILPDGSKQDVTATAQWSSSSAAVATVAGSGAPTVHTNGVGMAIISASSGGLTGSATVEVSAVTALAVTHPNDRMPVGLQQQFTATATYSNGKTQDLTSLATWSSSNGVVAAVSNDAATRGQVTSRAAGTAVITATVPGGSGESGVTVTNATLTSLAIDQGSATLARGTSMRLTATGTYSDNSTPKVTLTAAWSAAPAGIVSLARDGNTVVATATGEGTAVVTATLDGKSATTSIRVTLAGLTALTVQPDRPAIGLNIEPQQFTAIGSFSDGSTQDLTDQVTWSSSDLTVADIGNDATTRGLATGKKVGTTSIVATATSPVSMTSPPATLTVNASTPTVLETTPSIGPIGQKVALKGTNFDKDSTTVTVGGIPATFTRASSSYLEVTIPDTATGNNLPIVVTTRYGGPVQSPQTFSVITPAASPTVGSISPTLGPAGQRVVVRGANFIRGATTVSIGGTNVGAVTVTGTETLSFVVPTGIANGTYNVTVTTGIAPAAVIANGFTVGVPTGAPTITGMTPNYGPVGTYVIISGTNFVFGQTNVTIGGQVTTPFEFVGPESFSVYVPVGASLIGTKVTVQTPNGSAQSAENFTVTTHTQ